jgi:hypothetical protein
LAQATHLGGEVGASRSGLRCVGLEPRVDEHRRGHPVGMPGDDLLGHIPSHRNPADDRRAFHVEGIQQGHRVVSKLGDALGQAVATPAKAAEVGDDQPQVIGQRRLPLPHPVIERKGVEEHERHSGTGSMNRQAGVSHGDMVKGHHGWTPARERKRSKLWRMSRLCGSFLTASHWVRTARSRLPAAA